MLGGGDALPEDPSVWPCPSNRFQAVRQRTDDILKVLASAGPTVQVLLCLNIATRHHDLSQRFAQTQQTTQHQFRMIQH
jgi:hypothetical protein